MLVSLATQAQLGLPAIRGRPVHRGMLGRLEILVHRGMLGLQVMAQILVALV